MKLKPCIDGKKHSWKFVKNRTIHTKTITTARFTLKGLYQCRNCHKFKYGAAGNNTPKEEPTS